MNSSNNRYDRLEDQSDLKGKGMPKIDNMLAILWMLRSGKKNNRETNFGKIRDEYKDCVSLY